MKIAVIGGTGLIGSQVVKMLNADGHDAVAHSLTTGVDLLTGDGVAAALDGADVVVNLTNSPTFDDASPAFFQTSMDHLLAAASTAGVGHAVILSIVGADKVPDYVYYRAKVLQEDVLKAGPVPYSIVRSTQFDEFINLLITQAAAQVEVRLSSTTLQPITSADIARAVTDVVEGAPLNGTRNVAGPEVTTLDALGRVTLAAQGDAREVVVDDEGAGMFSAMKGDVLVPGPGDDAHLATTTYREWLATR